MPSNLPETSSGGSAMPRKYRVFIDTSALIAGLNSPTGAAGAVLALCVSGSVIPIISPQVIVEMEKNIPRKFPRLAKPWASFLLLPPYVTKPPFLGGVRKAHTILPTSDAPILASAFTAKPDALITWNTRDFKRQSVLAVAPFPVLTPGEFLARFRAEGF